MTHEYTNSKRKNCDTAKTNKIDLLAKEMNLNHEIIIFQEVDINSSKIKMRMMLRGDKIIKKYKFIELNLKTLSKNIKEKKLMNFPYKSKLTFNYNLTNDKNTVSQFIKEAKFSRDNKRNKSIFESNDDDDENCEEESEDSNKEKEDSNKDLKLSKNTNDKKIENKNNNVNNGKKGDNKTLSFNQRLKIFEKGGKIEKKNNNAVQPEIKKGKTIIQKIEKNPQFSLKIKQFENLINIKKNQTTFNKQNVSENIENDIINSEKVETNKIENINEIDKSKLNEKNEKENKSKQDIIKEEPKKSIINKIEKKINVNDELSNKIDEKRKSTISEKRNLIKQKIFQDKNIINNNNTNEVNDSNENNNNDYNPVQTLTGNTIDITKEQNLESFCNSFFICSFPYKDGKIMDNSKNYRSICNHPMCGKLISMEPEIIYKYPPNDISDLELNNLSASICFPTGIKICYNQERRSFYKSFFTHIINQKGEKCYMVIYHFYRKIDSMNYNQLYFDNPLKLYLRQFGDNTFCNNVEKEQLEKDLLECQELGFKDFVYIPYAIVMISKYPYINQMKKCLKIIYKLMSENEEILGKNSGIKKTSLIKEILSYLIYSIPIPLYNTEISFNLPLTSEKIKISSPYKDKIRDLENLNFTYIISKFCPENIIKIYQLMLFEQKLLFINKDNASISAVIDSFINILYPIDWVNTIIPIMSSPMVRYLQTFLPFVNGICEDLLENSANQALEDAEEGVFEIFIYNDTIKYSKPDYEEDIIGSIPKLPDEIYKKLYSELSDIADVYNNLNENEKQKYGDNINNMTKNIFFETTCILLYDLIDSALDEEKEFNGFSNSTLVKLYQKDAVFYKELIETQIFQNFINNFIKRKKDYTYFICMLKNITEKYVKTDISEIKGKKKWKKIIRKIGKKEVQTFPISFKIPFHLLNKEEITNYVINHKEWIEINNKIDEKIEKNENFLNNKLVSENDRIATKIIEIDSELKKLKREVYRYSFPPKSNFRQKPRHSVSMNRNKMNKMLLPDNFNKKDEIKKDSDLQDSLKEKIKNEFPFKLNIIISNHTIEKNESNLQELLNYVNYENGKQILAKVLYKKGFRVELSLKEDNYLWLNKICTKALLSLADSEENMINLEFAVKITSSAFYYRKENSNECLIDALTKDLGNNYYYWNKESFWNTWQIMENYFSISDYADYGSYCRIIMHDFSNKLLRLRLDKNFIINYLIFSIGEKMILMEHNNDLSQNQIQENQILFSEKRGEIIELINNYPY